MNKIAKSFISFVLIALLFVFSCQKKAESKDTMTEGKATIYVDESILPIVEDEVAVFEAEYKAKLLLVSGSENEIINSLLNDTANIAILARSLSDKELKAFESKKINPRIRPFAKDADPEIIKAINKSIKEMQDDGTLSKLSEKFYGRDVTQITEE